VSSGLPDREQPIRLGIDAVGAVYGGAERIALGAVSAAIENERVREVIVFASPAESRRFAFPQSEKLAVVEVRRPGGGAERVAWLCGGAPYAFWQRSITHALFLSGAGVTHDSTRKTLFVQQSLPFLPEAQETFGLAGRVRYRFLLSLMRWSAASADLVAVQTDTMRTLVTRELGCDARKVRVIPAGAAEESALRLKEAMPEREVRGPIRLFYVGSASPHKNLRVIADALTILHRKGHAAVLVATLESGEGLPVRDDIQALGYLGRSQLAGEMQRADCLVMPSLAETVCLPLVEAMGLAVPVVVADRPYAREVCGEAGLYFDPDDADALANAVVSLVRDQAAKTSRVAEGVRKARTFGSRDSFRTLIDAALELV
jgi:glycosyltransferase involved in cell wall biosynthesis